MILWVERAGGGEKREREGAEGREGGRRNVS